MILADGRSGHSGPYSQSEAGTRTEKVFLGEGMNRPAAAPILITGRSWLLLALELLFLSLAYFFPFTILLNFSLFTSVGTHMNKL